jgi:hypothetical protein
MLVQEGEPNDQRGTHLEGTESQPMFLAVLSVCLGLVWWLAVIGLIVLSDRGNLPEVNLAGVFWSLSLLSIAGLVSAFFALKRINRLLVVSVTAFDGMGPVGPISRKAWHSVRSGVDDRSSRRARGSDSVRGSNLMANG